MTHSRTVHADYQRMIEAWAYEYMQRESDVFYCSVRLKLPVCLTPALQTQDVAHVLWILLGKWQRAVDYYGLQSFPWAPPWWVYHQSAICWKERVDEDNVSKWVCLTFPFWKIWSLFSGIRLSIKNINCRRSKASDTKAVKTVAVWLKAGPPLRLF